MIKSFDLFPRPRYPHSTNSTTSGVLQDADVLFFLFCLLNDAGHYDGDASDRLGVVFYQLSVLFLFWVFFPLSTEFGWMDSAYYHCIAEIAFDWEGLATVAAAAATSLH